MLIICRELIKHHRANNHINKWTNELNRYFFKGRNTNAQNSLKKMLSISGQQGNTNQNCTEI
jgi:hypothetical protein